MSERTEQLEFVARAAMEYLGAQTRWQAHAKPSQSVKDWPAKHEAESTLREKLAALTCGHECSTFPQYDPCPCTLPFGHDGEHKSEPLL